MVLKVMDILCLNTHPPFKRVLNHLCISLPVRMYDLWRAEIVEPKVFYPSCDSATAEAIPLELFIQPLLLAPSTHTVPSLPPMRTQESQHFKICE
jgi:hypothetical protein